MLLWHLLLQPLLYLLQYLIRRSRRRLRQLLLMLLLLLLLRLLLRLLLLLLRLLLRRLRLRLPLLTLLVLVLLQRWWWPRRWRRRRWRERLLRHALLHQPGVLTDEAAILPLVARLCALLHRPSGRVRVAKRDEDDREQLWVQRDLSHALSASCKLRIERDERAKIAALEHFAEAQSEPAEPRRWHAEVVHRGRIEGRRECRRGYWPRAGCWLL